MTLPKTVRIAGVTIKIVEKDLSDFDDECYGYYVHDKQTIVIGKGLSAKVREETLCHEMIHAALDCSGISFSKGFEQLEEPLVRTVHTLFLPAWERVQKRLSKS